MVKHGVGTSSIESLRVLVSSFCETKFNTLGFGRSEKGRLTCWWGGSSVGFCWFGAPCRWGWPALHGGVEASGAAGSVVV
eukprot:SAG31_NODE_4051_length_3635_cov_15.463670_3_plen_80_part_00